MSVELSWICVAAAAYCRSGVRGNGLPVRKKERGTPNGVPLGFAVMCTARLRLGSAHRAALPYYEVDYWENQPDFQCSQPNYRDECCSLRGHVAIVHSAYTESIDLSKTRHIKARRAPLPEPSLIAVVSFRYATAAANQRAPVRRRAMKPTMPRPARIMAHSPGSGTGAACSATT